ncbi:peptidylprolyl isomerase [Ahrensia sp. R2A130]|uniref:peptidylprolyl isomerase n=1 Tax=Ahrensia sp. R2A130 TaxID=744979 RepID=UPI0001E0E0E5|nr:peptidylprolyl isomerase [Ahrensia sp. R2A130]EFL87959.1 peptidylprolyl isomerase PrsA1 [Ahrensia sp. R2A130]
MNKLTFRSAVAASTLALLVALPASAQEDKIVAKVGSEEITQSELDQAMADMAQQFAQFPEPQRKARALDALIDIEVFAALARKEGIDKDPKLLARMELLNKRALHNGYFTQKVQAGITDEQLQARYDKEIGSAPRQKEVKARHILVKTEEEAKAIIEELKSGADFVELAKTKSTGPSGPQGGDLGFFKKGQMVPEFEKAAFELEAGKVTETPVKTQFGFHIIKVDETRDTPLPTFEQSKEQLRQLVLTEAYAEAIKTGRESVGADVLDGSLKLPAGQ